MAAQDCLPTNNDKDNFGADYRVLNKLWNAISPDEFLSEYKDDYVWLSGVYESLKPGGGGGAAVWAALGAKTIELINNNVTVERVRFNEPAYYLEPAVIDVLMQDPVKGTREIAMSLNARLALHGNDPVFIELGRKLEALKEQHAQQLINATALPKALLQLAGEVAQAERQAPPADTADQGKAALTELFNEIQNERTPVIVKRIVDDIDNMVRLIRFKGWQKTDKGVKDIQAEILKIIWIQYKIKDKDIIDKAYKYVEQYY
jgi:type I restriction enzyme R subunit